LGSIAGLGNIPSREAVKAERATEGGEGPPAHGNGKYTYKGVFVNTVFISPRCAYSICMPFVFYCSDLLTRVLHDLVGAENLLVFSCFAALGGIECNSIISSRR
jgi:hypothetical protein